MTGVRFTLILGLFLLAITVACGGDDVLPGSTAEPAPVVTVNGENKFLVPPFEGPERETTTAPRQNYRLDPAWKLPTPASVSKPTDTSDPVLNPKPQTCPTDWKVDERPSEGLKFCYPSTWTVAREGYAGSPTEDQWFAAGVFDFADAAHTLQHAHVSVYVTDAFTRPMRFTLDCPQLYSVTFAGKPAVVCPTFPTKQPEARIIAYHVFANDLDYFVTIATYYEFNTAARQYSTETSADALATALQIANTVQLSTPVATSAPASAAPAASPTATSTAASTATQALTSPTITTPAIPTP
jgi:hypothetical protein